MTAPPSARCWRAPAIAFAPRAESGKASSVLASRRRVCGRFVVCPMTYAVGATSLRSVGGRTCLAALWTRTRQIPTAFVLPAPSGTGPVAPGTGPRHSAGSGIVLRVLYRSFVTFRGPGGRWPVGRSWDFTERAPGQTVFRFSPKPGVPQRFRNHMTGENGVSRCGAARPPGRFGGRSSRLQESIRRGRVERGWRQGRAAQASRDCRAALTYPCSTNHRAESAMASVAGREV